MSPTNFVLDVQYFGNLYIPLFLALQEKRQESRLKLKKNASMKTDVNRISLNIRNIICSREVTQNIPNYKLIS